MFAINYPGQSPFGIYIIDLMKICDVVFIYQLKTRRELDWHGRRHSHGEEEYEFHYFLQGDGTFVNDGTTHVIQKGSLFLSLPGKVHRIQATDRNRPISYYAVLFQPDEGDSELKQLLDVHFAPQNGRGIGTGYRFFFEQIKEHGMSPSQYLRRSAEHQLVSFLYSQAGGADAAQFSDEGNYHIEKALKIMQGMVFDHLSLGDLASYLGLDPSYLARLFRKKMQVSPMKYYTKLKIEAASSMLINTDARMCEISEKLCFSSEFHLSRVFKQHTGYAPTQYRKVYAQHLV